MVNVIDDWFGGVIITAEREALRPSSRAPAAAERRSAPSDKQAGTFVNAVSKVRLDMVAMYRRPNLEVIVTPHRLLFWEWQVQDDGDLFNSGFSSTRWKARYDGNAALFEVLAAGFYSEPLLD